MTHKVFTISVMIGVGNSDLPESNLGMQEKLEDNIVWTDELN